jgi:hypothetical protein
MQDERKREMKRMVKGKETARRATGLNVPLENLLFFFYSLDRKRSLTKSQRRSFSCLSNVEGFL